MKILRLSFKNLNSLAGVWEIDFTHPDYVSSGIFAITGPTGAGKTTILDAICLALYGQTPRLSRITQGENEIMSRQSGECFSEVEFETARGRFRCHWSQHRSRRQADGQLQPPRHEIAVAETGMILESKLRAVVEKVEEVTGMDFDRFTRSMLLAQGGFAAFLQARPDERAPILEQITGTAIYSRISIKVHERTSEERKRLGELQAGLDGIQLLAPEEEETLLREKSELLQAETALADEARRISEVQAWQERIAALEGDLQQLDQDRLAFGARKEAAAPELARLELAGRALKLAGEHAHILSVRNQQEVEQGELLEATERHPQLQQRWQTAFEALEQAESVLARAQVEQAQGAELIRMTRELDVKLGEIQSRLHGLGEEIEKIGLRNADYGLAISGCDQQMNGIREELQGVATFLSEHRGDAALAEALTGIEQQLKALRTLGRQCDATREKLGQQAARIESATLACGQAEALWEKTRQAVTEAEHLLAGIGVEREKLLQGRDLPTWRAEAETVAGRLNRLGTVQEAAARVAEVRQKLAELKLRGEEFEQKQQALARQEESLVKESELREQVSRQLQDNVVLLNRVRSLEEERRQLVDGAPCPLCGAKEHPYAAGNIPQSDAAQRELELALDGVKQVQGHLSLTRQDQVAVAKDLQRVNQDRTEAQERLSRDETFCANAFDELGMAVDPSAWAQAIQQECCVCQGELVRLRGVIQGMERTEQEERGAQTALNKLKDELAELDRARLSARLGEKNALAERERLEEEATALGNDLDRLLAEVKAAVAPYGCTDMGPDKTDQVLAALTARRNAYVERMLTRERLEKALADATANREQQRALLVESEKTLYDREQQFRDKIAQRDAMIEQRLEQYGERNPDTEEKRLAEALRVAGEQREAAMLERNRLQAELDGLNGQMERLTLSIARRGELLSGLEAALALRLAENGFANETAFLQAALPQERFDELTAMADSLRQEEITLHSRQADRREALKSELDRNLTDKTLDRVREENAAISAQLAELQKGLGALDQRLQQHAQQQERHLSQFRAIEMQKRECDRWERLHSLIGSGDGKKFRNFAQGLTFELMVAHANQQLQRMSDRYILVRDSSEPLELNVIDNYQAGEIRSTKNLSGGESFIASLALSLGLSGMASRNVRVDSLFLDEGFGTLDEDALETALETLSGLQQDGKLIGIISHVPALKERIGTQIQVEAGSSGRSTLSGPGCRRVS